MFEPLTVVISLSLEVTVSIPEISSCENTVVTVARSGRFEGNIDQVSDYTWRYQHTSY